MIWNYWKTNCKSNASFWGSSWSGGSKRLEYRELRKFWEVYKLLDRTHFSKNLWSQGWFYLSTYIPILLAFTEKSVLLTFLWTSIKYSGFLNTLNTFDSNSKITSFFCSFFSRFLFYLLFFPKTEQSELRAQQIFCCDF